MSKRIAIYARVSTDKQSTENQLIELRSLCDKLGYTIVQEYTDNGISGAKSRDERPALDLLLKDATRRRFDMVMCWSIDRLGRSLQHLVEILNELQALKIDLYFQQQGMDTSTPSGRMIFSVFGAIGEFERNLIRERVVAGQQRAKANGVKLGIPSKMNDGMRSSVKLLREKGMGIKQIAKQLQIGVGTVYTVMWVTGYLKAVIDRKSSASDFFSSLESNLNFSKNIFSSGERIVSPCLTLPNLSQSDDMPSICEIIFILTCVGIASPWSHFLAVGTEIVNPLLALQNSVWSAETLGSMPASAIASLNRTENSLRSIWETVRFGIGECLRNGLFTNQKSWCAKHTL